MYIRVEATMNLQIARWGNSLALRVPADVARRFGLREGDTVQAESTPDGALTLRATRWSRSSFADELARTRAALPMGTPVIDELRRSARY